MSIIGASLSEPHLVSTGPALSVAIYNIDIQVASLASLASGTFVCALGREQQLPER